MMFVLPPSWPTSKEKNSICQGLPAIVSYPVGVPVGISYYYMPINHRPLKFNFACRALQSASMQRLSTIKT